MSLPPESIALFASRIREHYPEGLTGIFTIGATRRTFILETQREESLQPGTIQDYSQMGDFLLTRYLSFCQKFFTLGGQNALVTILSYRSFFERGQQYAEAIVPETLRLINEQSLEFDHKEQVDPYFVGLEPLLHQPEGHPSRKLAEELQRFMQGWTYDPARKKIIWEVASLPLLSFWQMFTRMNEQTRVEIQQLLDSTSDLETIQRQLYRIYSKAIMGVDIPMPHFYLGNNMSGDLKWRAPMPLALTGGEYLRAYYTPYPLLFITLESFQHMIEDLAFGKRLHAPKSYDYTGQYTAELVQSEYSRIQQLANDPHTTLGLVRQVVKP
jgi:hypothetical protein